MSRGPWRGLAFWRKTGDEIAQRTRTVTLALANKREREGRILREVAETTGDEEILEVAEAREEEARRYRALERRNEEFEDAYFGGANAGN